MKRFAVVAFGLLYSSITLANAHIKIPVFAMVREGKMNGSGLCDDVDEKSKPLIVFKELDIELIEDPKDKSTSGDGFISIDVPDGNPITVNVTHSISQTEPSYSYLAIGIMRKEELLAFAQMNPPSETATLRTMGSVKLVDAKKCYFVAAFLNPKQVPGVPPSKPCSGNLGHCILGMAW